MSRTISGFLLLLNWYTLIDAEVIWKRRTDPVIFGDDVILFCLLPDSFDKSFPRQWKIGSKELTIDEGSVDKNKYEGSLEQNGFTLKIKQFRVEDFGRNYTCSYQFEKYGANLTTENYQWNPQPGTYEVDALKSTIESVKVKIRFHKVYPVPICIGLLGKKSILAKRDESQQVVDIYFLATSHTIEYQYEDCNLDCGENVSISCKFGNNSEPIITENISTPRQCEELCQRSSPCLNNGTCVPNKGTIKCDCTDGFIGRRCENSDGTTNQVLSSTVADAPETNNPIGTGLVVVLVVLLCLIVASFIVGYIHYRRYKKPSSGSGGKPNKNSNESETMLRLGVRSA